jgi:hypothetical protein
LGHKRGIEKNIAHLLSPAGAPRQAPRGVIRDTSRSVLFFNFLRARDTEDGGWCLDPLVLCAVVMGCGLLNVLCACALRLCFFLFLCFVCVRVFS